MHSSVPRSSTARSIQRFREKNSIRSVDVQRADTFDHYRLDYMVISTGHPAAVRESFLEGVKAAFLVSQLNRLGQVLCAKCGKGFTSIEVAWGNLRLHRVIDTGRGGYDGDLDWGEDHPNYLLLVCKQCERP